ncbi:MAG TPA: hypothetical protein PKE30_08740 [Niabella sp.]|nr:hypothetical protein [Niabella sp.]
MKRKYNTVFLFIICISLYQTLFAQPNPRDTAKIYDSLKQAYYNDRLSGGRYLRSIDSLTLNYHSNGINFSAGQLQNYLALFKTIAWSKKEYQYYRPVYFRYLMNNADIQGKGGEAIFFAEKYAAELHKQNKSDLSELYIRCAFYNQNQNVKKAIAAFGENKEYLKKLINLANRSDFNIDEGMIAMQTFVSIVFSYLSDKDTANAYNTGNMARQLCKAIAANPGIKAPPKAAANSMLIFINIELAIANRHFDKAKEFLNEQQKLIDTSKAAWGDISRFFEMNLTEWWLKYYLAIKDNKNTALYIRQLEKTPQLFGNQPAVHFGYKAKYAVNQNNFPRAYYMLDTALNEKEKEMGKLLNEIDDLLYAHAEAEFNKAGLAASEKEKQRRTLLMLSVILATLFIIVFILRRLRKEKIRSEKKIAQLNKMVEIQIAEEKEFIEKEAEKRLGQHLHDDLSAELAAALQRIHSLPALENNSDFQSEISKVSAMLKNSYEKTRAKSHSLYNEASKNHIAFFEQSVRKILGSALSDKLYKKEIDIEDAAVADLSLNARIEILRVVQEAITNIIKHASKADEVFLFLFKKNDEIVLEIGDNGRVGTGSSHSRESGMGIKSMQKRAQMLGGKLIIHTDNGTIIRLFVPLSGIK